MDGYDAQLYNLSLRKAKNNGLQITTSGKKVCLERIEDGASMGAYDTVKELFSYLCGYESGRNHHTAYYNSTK